ncbi:MAG: branched-chain amino acid ABC transporter permease [Rubellimicrobium sp.]|nr:branched-chain amino acid ABC transporter permease [Rubellimicrobium sp.]
MDQAQLARASFFVIPIFLLGLLVIPGGRALRVVLSVIAAVLVTGGLAASLDPGFFTYVASFSTMAMIYAILALGLNSQWGMSGHVNFGIAAFFSVGAFTSALVTTVMPTGTLASYSFQLFGLGLPYLAGVLVAGLVSALVGWLIAIPVLRLRTDFLAIATLGIAEIVRLIFQNERWLANGPQPLRGIPQPGLCLVKEPRCGWLPGWLSDWLAPLGARDYSFVNFVIVALVLAVIYVALERITNSPWGRVQRAVRDEEQSAAMSGKPVTFYRIESFVLGAFIMGVGGAVYAHYMVAIDYSHFNPLYATFIIWVMLMLGGSGNNRGAILGAFVIWAVWTGTETLIDSLSPALRLISDDLPSRSAYFRWMLVAILLAGIVLYRPQGILKERKRVSDYMPKGKGD